MAWLLSNKIRTWGLYNWSVLLEGRSSLQNYMQKQLEYTGTIIKATGYCFRVCSACCVSAWVLTLNDGDCIGSLPKHREANERAYGAHFLAEKESAALYQEAFMTIAFPSSTQGLLSWLLWVLEELKCASSLSTYCSTFREVWSGVGWRRYPLCTTEDTVCKCACLTVLRKSKTEHTEDLNMFTVHFNRNTCRLIQIIIWIADRTWRR